MILHVDNGFRQFHENVDNFKKREGCRPSGTDRDDKYTTTAPPLSRVFPEVEKKPSVNALSDIRLSGRKKSVPAIFSGTPRPVPQKNTTFVHHVRTSRASGADRTDDDMASQTTIAAVSYLNTIPFIHGIRREGSLAADLLLAPPADCARNFIEGRADIALVPAAVVPTLKGAEIVTDYCIGAVDEVRTVVIVSNTPIEEARRIRLDAHSRTSAQLARILAAELWKIGPEWCELSDYSLLDTPADGDAFLLIGDKVFDHEDEFIYTYDLAAQWHDLTQLPFAFAVWVARKGTPAEAVEALEASLTFGVERTYEAIMESEYRDRDYAYDYLTRNIDFLFDNEKHKALHKFWDLGVKVSPRVNPG